MTQGSATDATQPPFGLYGQLNEVAGRLVCHVCGGSYLSVGHHAQRAHGLSAADYRAEFGLNRKTPLCHADSSARYRQVNAPHLVPSPVHEGGAARRRSRRGVVESGRQSQPSQEVSCQR